MIHEFSDCHFPFPIICAILAPGLLFYRPKFIWSVPNMSIWGKIKRGIIETLPKAQRTRGLSSYHKLHTNLDQISYFRISNRYQLQNLKTSRLKLNLKILAKPSFRISTKIQITSTKHQQKKLTKLQLQISPLLQLRNLDQTLCSKSEQKFSFLTKPQLPNLQQTVVNTFLIININNSNFNKF